MAKPKTVDIPEVEVAEFPCVDQLGRRWEEQAGHDLVATFAAHGGEVQPPVCLAHDEAHPLMVESGLPALGWGARLRMKGSKLLASFRQVPAKVADLIRQGAYKRISASWWPDGAQAGVAGAEGKPVIRHFSLLGADIPRIKTLADVQALYGSSGEAAAALSEAPPETVAVFAEVAAAAPEAETAPAGPDTLKAAIEEETEAAPEPTPLSTAIAAIRERLWVIDDTERADAEKAEALKGLADELTRFLEAYEPPAAAPEAPVAEAAAAMAEEPETLSEAVQAEAAGERLRPVIRAVSERLWAIEDKEGRTEEEKAQALRDLGAEIQAFFEKYDAADEETPAEEAAAETPAAMSDAARDAVASFLALKKARGHWKPAWDAGLRSEAAAVFAEGGDGALASFLARAEAVYVSEVAPTGEIASGAKPGAQDRNGAATFADTPAGAAAAAEYDEAGLARSLGITKEAYLRARAARGV